MAEHWSGSGTAEDPWKLKTPPLSSEYTIYRDDAADPALLVCQVGGTRLTYLARAIDDLHEMLVAARRLDAARRSGRAEGCRSRHGRGVGAFGRQPGRRLVRPEEGAARTVRDVPAAAAGSARDWWSSSTTPATTASGRSASKPARRRAGSAADVDGRPVASGPCRSRGGSRGRPGRCRRGRGAGTGTGGSAGCPRTTRSSSAAARRWCRAARAGSRRWRSAPPGSRRAGSGSRRPRRRHPQHVAERRTGRPRRSPGTARRPAGHGVHARGARSFWPVLGRVAGLAAVGDEVERAVVLQRVGDEAARRLVELDPVGAQSRWCATPGRSARRRRCRR